MKKFAAVVVALVTASAAMGQVVAPLGQSATPIDVGKVIASANLMVGLGNNNDYSSIGGGRLTFGAAENFLVSADLGHAWSMLDRKTVRQLDPTMGDAERKDIKKAGFELPDIGTGVAALSAQYSLSSAVELPFDLAVRGGFNMVDFKRDWTTLDILGVISAKMEQVDGLEFYGAAGVAFSMGNLVGRDELIVVGGFTYALPTDNVSVFGEISLVDDAAIAAGVRVAF